MIGQKIKDRRTEQDLSLRELGEITGLTAGFLSQIENGLTDPSISSLQRIATALKVPMFTFLNGGSQPEQVVRHDARKKLSFPDPHLEYELLTNDLTRQMAGFLIHLKSGESHQAQQLYKATEEMLFVLQGELEITISSNTYQLHPGDSIYYEGSQLIRFSSTGSDELIMLCTITPPVF
ncbi:MAG: helix-turn-helix domain-containing protein [Anaerolineaceae bacterium]|nr:helix-turn-helix domain-containing protein [Anaerolineaceae bacterium]